MDPLYARLRAAGVTPKFVRETALPEWWEDRAAADPAAYAQALTLISRNLGVSLESLQDPDAPIRCREFGETKFKRQAGVGVEELKWARCISARAAELACSAVREPFAGVPKAASVIRERILSTAACVNLASLLDYCWEAGVPVLHVSQFPSGSKKMHGLAASINGRPAIVLSRNDRHPAWLVFILAHELGHVGSGHLAGDGLLVDEKVSPDSRDAEEAQATAFGIELLTGHPDLRLTASRYLTAEELARNAVSLGDRMRIDPGIVALNYAWARQFFAVARKALDLIDPQADAVRLVRREMLKRLDWDRLSEESADFLLRVTGADGDA